MDFAALIKKSFTLTWNNRILWLFGLLAGGMGATGGGSVNFPSTSSSSISRSTTNVNSNRMFEETSSRISSFVHSIPAQSWFTIILVLLAVIIALILVGIFVSSWARAALVYSTLNIHSERPTFKKGSRAGLKYWWKFYLLTLVFGLITLAFILLLLLPILFLYLARLQTIIVLYIIFGFIIFILGLIIFSLFSSLIISLAQRLIIHRGLGVLESIRVSGGLIKKHLGEMLLTYFLGVGLNFAAGFGILILFIPIALVCLILFFITPYLLIAAAIPALLLVLVIGGFLQAYTGVYWTLFYQHIASKEGW